MKNDFLKKKNDLLYELMNLEINTTLVDNLLMKVDKNTMAHSVEARVPFLDYAFAEKAFQIPTPYKMKGFKEKYILRRAMKGVLPKETVKIKKERFFVPINSWFKGELMDITKQLLSKENIKKQNIFDYYYIDKIFRNFNKSELFYSRQLWELLTFQLWHKMYFENKSSRIDHPL